MWTLKFAALIMVLSSLLAETVGGTGNRSFYTHLNEREVRREWAAPYSGDCMGGQRKYMRPYPYDCYGHKFADSNREWEKFYSEISGDLRFTFDFVLYDEKFPFAKENQLWYLIAFLKELRILVPNPEHILKKSQAIVIVDVFKKQLEEKVKAARDSYKKLLHELEVARLTAKAHLQHLAGPRGKHQVASKHASNQPDSRGGNNQHNNPQTDYNYNVVLTDEFDNENIAYGGKNTVLIKNNNSP